MNELNIDVSSALGDGRVSLIASGDIDTYTVAQLREALLDVATREPPAIYVDLRAVEFIDSTGLGVLIGGLKRQKVHGGTLELIAPSPQIRNILRTTGLLAVLLVRDDLPTAISADPQAV